LTVTLAVFMSNTSIIMSVSSLWLQLPFQFFHCFFISILFLLRLQSNLVCGFCTSFDLPELHHCLDHIWCIWTHNSNCLGISSCFFLVRPSAQFPWFFSSRFCSSCKLAHIVVHSFEGWIGDSWGFSHLPKNRDVLPVCVWHGEQPARQWERYTDDGYCRWSVLQSIIDHWSGTPVLACFCPEGFVGIDTPDMLCRVGV
jgi:hypothetical protein